MAEKGTLKRPASSLALKLPKSSKKQSPPEKSEEEMLILSVWNDVKERPTVSECRKNHLKFEKGPIPEALKGKSLNEKLEIFKAGVTADMGPDMLVKIMRGIFTENELSTLWMRFSTVRKMCTQNAREAWDRINSMSWNQGKTEKKERIMAIQLVRPFEWENFAISETQSLVKTQSETETKTRFYYGELCTTHGQSEVDWVISRGKLVETVDSDDDVCYIKRVKVAEDKLEHKKEAKTHKHGKITSGELDNITDAFADDFKMKSMTFKGTQKLMLTNTQQSKPGTGGKASKGKGKGNDDDDATPPPPKPELTENENNLKTCKALIAKMNKNSQQVQIISAKTAGNKMGKDVHAEAQQLLKEIATFIKDVLSDAHKPTPDNRKIVQHIAKGEAVLSKFETLKKIGKPFTK